MNDLVNWLFSKVMIHLTLHEGCTGLQTTKTSNEIKSVIQDSLGFRYEVQIKCLGRIQHVESIEKVDTKTKSN